MKPAPADSGVWGETLAADYLKAKGWRILGVRVRLDRRDELDIVACDGEVLVFVEVKTRRNEAFGRPAAAVNREKRRVLCRAAMRYLKRLKQRDVYFRFDIVEVIGTCGSDATIRHIENAFPLDKRYSLP